MRQLIAVLQAVAAPEQAHLLRLPHSPCRHGDDKLPDGGPSAPPQPFSFYPVLRQHRGVFPHFILLVAYARSTGREVTQSIIDTNDENIKFRITSKVTNTLKL